MNATTQDQFVRPLHSKYPASAPKALSLMLLETKPVETESGGAPCLDKAVRTSGRRFKGIVAWGRGEAAGVRFFETLNASDPLLAI